MNTLSNALQVPIPLLAHQLSAHFCGPTKAMIPVPRVCGTAVPSSTASTAQVPACAQKRALSVSNKHWQQWGCNCGMISLREIQESIPDHLAGMLGNLPS